MDLFRITRKKYIRDITGEGARLYGGRWNYKGTSVLYTSPTISLAVLELLANTPTTSIPDDLEVLSLVVPDSIHLEQIKKSVLPDYWETWPSPNILKDMGTRWIKSKSSLLLKVPSAVVPMESNILINPGHPGFDNIKIKAIHEFRFDKRFKR